MPIYGQIYLIKNIINNKIYVGQTTKTFNQRYKYSGEGMERAYKYNKQRRDKGLRHNQTLIRAYEKYGNSAFVILENYKIAFSKEELNALEIECIKEFDSFRNGYNLSEGGEAVRGLKDSLNYKSKKVICITTGEVFESINGAVRLLKGKSRGVTTKRIIHCSQGESAFGGTLLDGTKLQWAYLDDYNQGILHCKEREKEKWIVCLNSGKIYASLTEASDDMGIDIGRISKHLKGVRPSAGIDADGNKIVFERYLKESAS